ncbi:cytochrome P450 [Actinoplanes sp. LDG1-06]|uniref:Cytochrome P450 n=1 Tax=Paractinoplanes ovalisporus TaxID=2810368 RepID=A0ABS2AJX6_9ACTN|nr:cytochrome P450 [Actinoplanes ovalisporus]MBM2620111.1 cytochrome P450 [Actinoplanes ovalisporus]
MSRPKLPGPSRASAFRQLMIMQRDRIGMMTGAAERYGDAVAVPVAHKTLYFFNHPDLVRHVLADNAANYRKGIGLSHARRALGDGLLTSEGELWRKQRHVIQPSFQSRRLARHADAIAQEAGALVTRLRKRSGGEPFDVVTEMTGLTLGVLGRTLLESDLGGFSTLGDAFGAVQDQAMFELATLSAVPMWMPLPHQMRFRRARRELQRVVDHLVRERGDRAGSRDDVLSRLIVSAGQERDPRVGRIRLRDELVTLLLAGHETTASTLCWTLALLDQHPQVRDRVAEEARAVLGDRLPGHADLARLPFATMVVQEAMRLYPPVWLLPRQSLADDEVGGHRVPAGADVLVCPYTLHRHPEFWEDPDRFDPDRFDGKRQRDRPRYAYLPFGAGPRVCVGSVLGMMEAVFVIALVSRELRLTVQPGHRVRPEPMLSLRIRGGLPVTAGPAAS